VWISHTVTHGNSLQHTALHYNTLQLTAAHCNTCNALWANRMQKFPPPLLVPLEPQNHPRTAYLTLGLSRIIKQKWPISCLPITWYTGSWTSKYRNSHPGLVLLVPLNLSRIVYVTLGLAKMVYISRLVSCLPVMYTSTLLTDSCFLKRPMLVFNPSSRPHVHIFTSLASNYFSFFAVLRS